MTLLCPIHVPLWWTMMLFGALSLLALLPFALAYRLLWRSRYRTGSLANYIRLRGRVVHVEAPADRCQRCRELAFESSGAHTAVSRIFVLRDGERMVRVDPKDARMPGRRGRVSRGDAITVEGIGAALPRRGEQLFRDAATEEGVAAVRIIRGTWPELRGLTRWLTITVVICWCIVAFTIH
jgi:hypothetical protein